MKLSSDQKKLFTIDYHTIKVWDLVGGELFLRQEWTDPKF